MGLLDLFKKKGSSDVAKDRLKLLLVSDRANCSPEVMEMIKNDIIKLDAIQTAYEKELNEMTLAKNKILGSILIFFCFVLTGLTIYIVVKK